MPDTIQIRIINSTNAFTEHSIHRAVIQTSDLLCPGLDCSLIEVGWLGSLGVFDMYKAWLYSHNIFTTVELRGTDPRPGTTKSGFVDLICCWGMGQTLEDETYQDEIITSIQWRLEENEASTHLFIDTLTPALVTNVYLDTAPSASLRKVIVDAAARYGDKEDFDHFRWNCGYPLVFIEDLIVALAKQSKYRDETPMVFPPPLFHSPTQIRYSPDEYRNWSVEENDGSRLSTPPPPFLSLRHDLGPRQPRSILKKRSGTRMESRGKNVRFTRSTCG